MRYYIGEDRKFISPNIQNATVEEAIEYLSNLKYIGLDFETEGFDPHTKKPISLQLGNFDRQYVVNCSEVDIKLFKEVLENKEKVIIGQNIKFDLKFAYKHGVYPRNVYDTMLAEEVLYHGINDWWRSLKYLGKSYCDVELNKEVRGKIHKVGLSEEVIEYGADDVKYLEEIMMKQLDLAVERGVEKHIEVENKFVRALAYIEYCGIYLNKDKWEEKINITYKKREAAINALDDYIINNSIAGYGIQYDLFNPRPKVEINWSSSHQVKKLFKSFGMDLKVVEKGETKESVNANVIKKYTDSYPIVKLYAEYQEYTKELSTYGYNMYKFINPETGRIHPNFWQIKSTGRLGVSDPNVQNIPNTPENRQSFTPQDPNNDLIDSDYSAQEDKIFANFSKEPKLIDFHLNTPGADGHSYVAKLCFPEELDQYELDEVKGARPDLRQKAKSAKFAIHYGGTGFTIAKNLNISVEEGGRIEKAYLAAFPQIKEYFDKVEDESIRNRYILVDPITGFKNYLPDVTPQFLDRYEKIKSRDFWMKYRDLKNSNSPEFPKVKEKVREFMRLKSQIRNWALNYPIQGSSATLTKMAGSMFFDYILDNNLMDIVLMVNAVHDEILLECPKSISTEVAKKLKYYMELAAEPYCELVPLTADPEIADFWTH